MSARPGPLEYERAGDRRPFNWGWLVLIVVVIMILAGAAICIVPAFLFQGMPAPSDPPTTVPHPMVPAGDETE